MLTLVFFFYGCLNKQELKKIITLKDKKKIIVLHCVSSYPLKTKECNFQKFNYLKGKFKDVGYSGHLEGINDAIFAIANNACIIEKHFTINKKLPGRDNKFSYGLMAACGLSYSINGNKLQVLVSYQYNFDNILDVEVKNQNIPDISNFNTLSISFVYLNNFIKKQ